MIDEPDKIEIDYSLSFLKRPLYWGTLAFIFIFTIVLNFPLSRTIDQTISNAFSANPSCPIEFGSYSFNFLGIEFSNVTVPSLCTGGKPLVIKKIDLGLSGFSFSPFGPSFNLETEVAGIPVNADIAAGLGGLVILMENDFSSGEFEYPEQKISLSKLSDTLPLSLVGDIYVSNFHLKTNFDFSEIDIFTVNIVSINLLIPNQTLNVPNLGPFKLEKGLMINDLLILGQLENGGKKPIFKLERFTLGDDSAPLRTEFKGKIFLNPQRPKSSVADLTGELKLSDEFPQKGLLALVLGRFDQRDEFYQIQLRGAFNDPNTLKEARSPRD